MIRAKFSPRAIAAPAGIAAIVAVCASFGCVGGSSGAREVTVGDFASSSPEFAALAARNRAGGARGASGDGESGAGETELGDSGAADAGTDRANGDGSSAAGASSETASASTSANTSASTSAGAGAASASGAGQASVGAASAGAAATNRVVDARESGGVWPVDALVGQINGRPVFADDFLEPISDQLKRCVANPDRVVGREQFLSVVKSWFKRTVDSELVVAEAESQLSPEQQQGLLAWLKSIQEETIAERGGSRAAAEESLQAEGTGSLDEFMRERRDFSLAMRLLNQRLEPRSIVSWREVEQAYERDRKLFNPPQQLKLGRMRFDTVAEAEKIERVKALAAEGKSFTQVAKELGVADGGLWQSTDLPPQGIEGLPLSDAIKARIKGLEVDRMTEPLQSRDFTIWYSVLAIETPASRSIYDRDVQLALYAQLRDVRRSIEQQRYIGTLRSRWVTDDIGEMEERLVAFALERYWR
jgi:hypothetical protein